MADYSAAIVSPPVHWSVLPIVAALLAAACAGDPDPGALAAPAIPFLDRFERVAEVVPDQGEEHLIARVADIEIDDAGRLYVVDPLERNVKVYGPSGALEAGLGREGRGPGEFVQPWRVEIGPAGAVHVLDLSLDRIVVFDSLDDGEPRTVHVRGLGGPQDFALLDNGHYAVIDRWGVGPGALVLVDGAGREYARYLDEIRTLTPLDQPDGPVWEYPRVLFARDRGDTVYVTSSLLNRLWAVNHVTGDVVTTTVDFEAYRPITLPPSSDPAYGNATAMIEWFTGFHLNGFTVPYPGGFLWTFVKGDYWSGDPRVVLHRDRRTGRWEALEDAPIIAAANANVVVGVEAVATDEMRFLLFRKRD